MTKKITQQVRYQWVSIAAYFRAEQRGFEPGRALDDWLQAEQEFREQLIYQFVLQSREDGEMSLQELQNLAYSLGLEDVSTATSNTEIITAIQRMSNEMPCYHPDEDTPCNNPERYCHWRAECQRLVAVWYR